MGVSPTKGTMQTISILMLAIFVSGCATMQVKPIESTGAMRHVCIETNPRVLVTDFVPVVQSRLEHHGITSVTYQGTKPEGCQFVMTYTAIRGWDMAPYLRHAEIVIEHQGRQYGSATFDLTGGGGLDPNKWDSTKTKMDPVIDVLLGAAPIPVVAPVR